MDLRMKLGRVPTLKEMQDMVPKVGKPQIPDIKSMVKGAMPDFSGIKDRVKTTVANATKGTPKMPKMPAMPGRRPRAKEGGRKTGRYTQ